MEQNVECDPNCEYCREGKNIWPFIDTGYVICLQERDDRYQRSLKQVHQNGLCQVVKFYRPTRDKQGSVYGCWNSHVNACRASLEKPSHATTLVLEDDFFFDEAIPLPQVVEEIKSALLKLPEQKWTRLSLGHISWFSVPYRSGVHRSSSVLAHAQIWSERGLRWMATNGPDERASKYYQLDGHISLKLPFSYSIYPMRVFQADVGSENALKNNGSYTAEISPSFLKADEIIIPLAYLIGIFVLVLLATILLWKWQKWSMSSSLAFGFCLFAFPFLLVWILMLTSVL